jgi:hypothetical protein
MTLANAAIKAETIEAGALDGMGDWNTTTPPTADAVGTNAASKILETPANKLKTDAGGAVTTDAASREASQASIEDLATSEELAAVLETLLIRIYPNVATDVDTTPFELVLTNKDTGEELLRQKLYQIDGTPVTSADHLVAKKEAVL